MRHLAVILALTLSLPLIAQEGPTISSAIIALERNNEVKQAKEYIDEAAEVIEGKPLSEIKNKDLSKFYYYKGLINERLVTSKDSELQNLDPQALDKSLKGYQELLTFEEKSGKKRYTEEAQKRLASVTNELARRAIQASQKKEFKKAFDDFMRVYEIKKKPFISQLDTSMLYNGAVMAQNAKMYDTALDINKKLLKLGYKGVTFSAVNKESGEKTVFPSREVMNQMVQSGRFKDPSVEGNVEPSLYQTTSSLALNQGDTAYYQKLVQEGREKYPDNAQLLRAELQILFDKKEYDKALGNLDQAIANEPENPDMYYNKGVILQTEMQRFEEALKSYKKTLELDSGYTDALYMTSIIYIDSANAVGDRMNDLPLDEEEKYEKLKSRQKSIFEEALPYLERAYKANPEDPQVVKALRQVYRALGMYEKAKGLSQ